MKNQNSVYVTKTLIQNKSLDELDMELYEEFKFDYDSNDEFIEIQNGQGQTYEAMPIKIDVLIEMCQKMKELGATHIEIEHHVDHHGYDISSFKIKKSSKLEIKQYEDGKKLSEEVTKQLKIQKLTEELQSLKK